MSLKCHYSRRYLSASNKNLSLFCIWRISFSHIGDGNQRFLPRSAPCAFDRAAPFFRCSRNIFSVSHSFRQSFLFFFLVRFSRRSSCSSSWMRLSFCIPPSTKNPMSPRTPCPFLLCPYEPYSAR